MIAPLPTASSDSPAVVSAWEGYRAWPVRSVHPARIVACFNGTIEADAARRLQENSRFSARLENMLRPHFELPQLDGPAPADPADALIAAISSDDLVRLTALSGLIRRGGVFAGEIRSNVVRSYNSQFGDANVRQAVANRDLAVKGEIPSDPTDIGTLVASEGNICLAAWMAPQPHSIQAWFRMKMERELELPQSVNQERSGLDREIVRRAAIVLFGSGIEESRQ